MILQLVNTRTDNEKREKKTWKPSGWDLKGMVFSKHELKVGSVSSCAVEECSRSTHTTFPLVYFFAKVHLLLYPDNKRVLFAHLMLRLLNTEGLDIVAGLEDGNCQSNKDTACCVG